ncbi:MAG: Trm112 family protein [Candidatus Zixiibacteriota bacterium]|nr:MAG: Trm112 family protein [candidate division Zixibacteria bacterium]
MTLPEGLLKKLVCPNCKGVLIYQEKECRLVCDRCRLAYRIDNDVPVMLVDEAEKL